MEYRFHITKYEKPVRWTMTERAFDCMTKEERKRMPKVEVEIWDRMLVESIRTSLSYFLTVFRYLSSRQDSSVADETWMLLWEVHDEIDIVLDLIKTAKRFGFLDAGNLEKANDKQ